MAMNGGDKNQPLSEGRRDFSNLRALGLVSLAVLFYALLLDAAIETFWNKSPVRWWIIIPVAVYLSGSIALWWRGHSLWSRTEWKTKATISSLVLLGLLAFTVWLPGGLTQGLKLVGQSTSTVLAVVTAVGVAYSGMILFRLNYPHPGIKWGIAVLSVYGVSVFLWGIPADIPYSNLFRGQGFWSWVSRLGAFIGALVLVGAFLYQIPNILRQARSIELEKWGLQQVIALGLCLLMVFSGVTSPAGFSSSQPSAAQITAKALPEGAAGTSTAVREASSARRSSAVEIGRELIYPEVVAEAASLGRDVKRMLDFVSNDISYEPYDGALRGSRGTLLAKAGNATDKALLLRDLLRLAEPTAELRFAFCKLPSEEAQQMVSTTLTTRPPLRQERDAANRSGTGDAASKKPPEDEHRRALADRMIGRWRSLADELRQEAAALETTLRRAGVTVDSPPAPRMELEKRAQRHVWLQYRQESSWVDLDPTIAGAVPGQRRCSVEHAVAALQEDFYHHLSIDIVLVERQDARSNTRSLLQIEWRTADLVGSTITYAHAEPLGLGELVRGSSPPAQSTRYTPLLIVDDELRVGKSFVLPRPPSIDVPGPKALGGAIGEMLGSGQVGQESGRTAVGQQLGNPQPTGEAEVTSLWLRFVVTPPNGPPETLERPILDRIGYAARAGGEEGRARLSPIESARGDYVPMQTIWSVATWTGEAKVPLSLYPALAGRRKAASVTGLHSVLEDLGILHRGFYGLRQFLFKTATPLGGERVFVPNVNLSLLSWAIRPRDSAVPGGAIAIDLLENRVGHAPGPGAGTPAWILWGQASLQAERLVLLGPRALTGTAPDQKNRGLRPDVSSVFAQARQEQLKLLLLGPADGPKIETLVASDEARARLRARLAEGRTILVPERAVRMRDRSVIGWWLIDSKSGSLVDEMEDGRHGGGVESTLQTKGSEEQAAAEEEASRRKFRKVVVCLAVLVQFGLNQGLDVVAARHGDLKVFTEVQETFSDFEGVLEECETDEVPPPPPGRMAGGPKPPFSDVGVLPDGRVFFTDYPPPLRFPR